MAVPTYDKSAYGGRGDRGAVEVNVEAPLDVVFVEGWMLGFRAFSEAECPPALRASNAHLPGAAIGRDRTLGSIVESANPGESGVVAPAQPDHRALQILDRAWSAVVGETSPARSNPAPQPPA